MGGSCLCVLLACMTATLTVYGSAHVSGVPKITQAPRNKKVSEDGPVSLICKASGNPAPTFHWERGGKKIYDRKSRFEIKEAPYISVLRIHQTRSRSDDSNYTCVATNGLGEAKADASLKIYAKLDGKEDIPPGYPRIKKHPDVIAIQKNRSELLECDVKGDPKPTITWLKDGFPVDDTDPRIQILNSGYLQIRNSQKSDEAAYECVAENEIGVAYSDRVNIYIAAPIGSMGPPENLQARAASASTIVVSWNEPKVSNGIIQGYKVLYRRTGADPSFFWEQQVVKSDTRLATITGLVPNVNYLITVVAFSDVGQGPGSFLFRVPTTQGAPSGAPLNFSATGLTETSVRLTWDLPARNLRNGDILMYQISYNKHSDPLNEEDLNSTDTFVDLVGLEMNTDYNFKIRAYTESGPGPWSNKVRFRTFGRMPPTPKNVKIRRSSETTIEVRWDEPDVPVSGYRLFYKKLATPAIFPWPQLEIGPYTEAEISGLEPRSVYVLQLQAKSVDGRYGNMSRLVFIQDLDVPSTPIGFDTTLPTLAPTTPAQTTQSDSTVQDTTERVTSYDSTTAATLPSTVSYGTSESTRLPIRNDFECHLTYMDVFLPEELAPNSVLKLRNSSCQLSYNGSHYVTSFSYNECGTTQEYYYTNLILVKNEITVHVKLDKSDSIQFAADYTIPLTCVVRVNSTAVSGAFQVVDRDPFSPEYGHSPDLVLREYANGRYEDEITQYPVKVPINREIFFELAVTQSREDGNGIKIDKCEATPTPDANDTVRYLLISDGCPASPAVRIIPSPEKYRIRFIVQTFHFNAPANQSNLVYVHCYASGCQQFGCYRPCLGFKRRRRSSNHRVSTSIVSSGSHIIVPE